MTSPAEAEEGQQTIIMRSEVTWSVAARRPRAAPDPAGSVTVKFDASLKHGADVGAPDQ